MPNALKCINCIIVIQISLSYRYTCTKDSSFSDIRPFERPQNHPVDIRYFYMSLSRLIIGKEIRCFDRTWIRHIDSNLAIKIPPKLSYDILIFERLYTVLCRNRIPLRISMYFLFISSSEWILVSHCFWLLLRLSYNSS